MTGTIRLLSMSASVLLGVGCASSDTADGGVARTAGCTSAFAVYSTEDVTENTADWIQSLTSLKTKTACSDTMTAEIDALLLEAQGLHEQAAVDLNDGTIRWGRSEEGTCAKYTRYANFQLDAAAWGENKQKIVEVMKACDAP